MKKASPGSFTGKGRRLARIARSLFRARHKENIRIPTLRKVIMKRMQKGIPFTAEEIAEVTGFPVKDVRERLDTAAEHGKREIRGVKRTITVQTGLARTVIGDRGKRHVAYFSIDLPPLAEIKRHAGYNALLKLVVTHPLKPALKDEVIKRKNRSVKNNKRVVIPPELVERMLNNLEKAGVIRGYIEERETDRAKQSKYAITERGKKVSKWFQSHSR